jgi:RNase adaptor protein for sRNA GlmZ degradation
MPSLRAAEKSTAAIGFTCGQFPSVTIAKSICKNKLTTNLSFHFSCFVQHCGTCLRPDHL